MWGGRNDDQCCNILFCFDTITHQWSKPEVNGEAPAVRDGIEKPFFNMSVKNIQVCLSRTHRLHRRPQHVYIWRL